MTKTELKLAGFKKEDGFLVLDLKHDFTLIEGDKYGYLDVFELNHSGLRFKNIDDIKTFIQLINA